MSSACDVLGEGACSRGSVLVQDSLQAPATFMIPLLLKHALKQGDKVRERRRRGTLHSFAARKSPLLHANLLLQCRPCRCPDITLSAMPCHHTTPPQVVFVAAAQPKSHYKQVMRKMVWNISSLPCCASSFPQQPH